MPALPDGKAGEVLEHAITAAGGWDRWVAVRDVSYVSVMTITDPVRMLASDSIGWFTAPLHGGVLARMEAMGLPHEVLTGIDAGETWILSNGRPITEPTQLAMTRFEMLSSLFWFSLPFRLAEGQSQVTYVGTVRGPAGEHWDKLKAVFPASELAAPGEWFVLYINRATGLIDQVHCKLSAPFLSHNLWVGQWRYYRDCDGIQKERQRQFYPANDDGEIVGAMIAEQFIERVHFNNGYTAQHFRRPAATHSTPVRSPADPAERFLPAYPKPQGGTLSPAGFSLSHGG
ncbi:MAG: hypothetical protein AB7N53_05200 [Candidatus Binatia bacterium]